MHVLLDTNIYLSDITFSRPEFQALKNYLSRTNHKVLIPEVIQLEIEKNIKSISIKEVQKIFDLSASKLGVINEVPNSDDIYNAIKANLDKTILHSRTTKLIPSNSISLDVLVKRSLEETPPFKNKGRGFRDALIWYSLLDYLKNNQGQVVAFISSNSDDFGNNNLKTVLVDELKENGFDKRVIYFNNLGDFLTEYSEPLSFLDETYIRQGVDDIAINHLSIIEESDIEVAETHLEDYEIDYSDFESYDIENFYVYGSTSRHYLVYVELTYVFNLDISAMSYQYNHYVGDWDWYPEKEETLGFVTAEFSLTINRQTQEIAEVDYF